MEFIKNLFKTVFKKKDEKPEINVNWDSGIMTIKSKKKLSREEVMEIIAEQIEKKECEECDDEE